MAYMDVQVKLNDVDISQYVISYTREHKICTGIGTLSMDVTYELVNDLIPWDAIDIYEGGDHVGTYYVGSVSDNQPTSTISIEAQDNSKRLSDYFITDTYLIDYISYTKYWIEFFLQEVGVQYEFLVSGDGSLINQNTSLGLASAYEQIQTLLQMSGWYITFNTNGKALIGKLTTDISTHSHRLNLHDMTEFKLIQSDKMYRNRALIWGAGSPTSDEWVFADVTKHTRWDYDDGDLRTIVIANSAIPDVASAFMLANQLLIEFCRLNEEKDMTLIGTYSGMTVGSSVYVNTRVWTGSGLVTTFGVNMTRSGLTTHVVLDERCPRLYGFFDVGGKVYVGTYGSGVWRHDIKYLGALWEDYSSGVSPQTTDLHVNNGILAAVGAEGGAYYNLEGSLPWHQFPIADLPFVLSGEVTSGIINATISGTVSSGLMVRACIIDRLSNRLKYAVDTRSGYNLGDYLIETDPLTLSGAFSVLSGFANAGSGLRSWIVDGNAYDGSIGDVYPIHVSGNYETAVFDIENDGFTDYVSVATLSSGFLIPNLAGLFDFGYRTNSTTHHDGRIRTSFNQTNTFNTTSGHYISPGEMGYSFGVSIYNNTIIGERDIIYLGSDSAQRRFYYDRINVGGVALTRTQKAGLGNYKTNTWGIFRKGTDLFDVYGQDGNVKTDIIKDSWNSSTGVVTKTVIGSLSFTFTNPREGIAVAAVGNMIYIFEKLVLDGTNRFKINKYEINTDSDSFDGPDIIFEGTARGLYLEGWTTYGGFGNQGALPGLFRKGDSYQLIVPYQIGWQDGGGNARNIRCIRYSIEDGMTDEDVATEASPIKPYLWVYGGAQLTKQHSVVVVGYGDTDFTPFGGVGIDTLYEFHEDFTTSESITDVAHEGIPFAKHPLNIYPSYGSNSDHYIAIAMSGHSRQYNGPFHKCQYNTLESVGQITNPDGISILSPFPERDTSNDNVYWAARLNDSGANRIITMDLDTPGELTRSFYSPMTVFSGDRMLNGGNFFAVLGGKYIYYDNVPSEGRTVLYYILQRDIDDYNVLYSGAYQQRLDISLFSPLVAMDRRLSSTQIYNINISGVAQSGNAALSGINLGGVGASGLAFDLGIIVNDYRYSSFEWNGGHTLETDLFAAYNGDLGIMDLNSLAVFSGIFTSPSGTIMKVEASNFSLPEQYTFLATSGDVSGFGFFEKTPSGISYLSLTDGFPQVRPTIIRLDDKL